MRAASRACSRPPARRRRRWRSFPTRSTRRSRSRRSASVLPLPASTSHLRRPRSSPPSSAARSRSGGAWRRKPTSNWTNQGASLLAGLGGLGRQRLVGAVAERHRLRALAAAEPHFLRLAHGEPDRLQLGLLVRAVAEGLAARAAAAAPPVVPRGKLDGVRATLRDMRLCHDASWLWFYYSPDPFHPGSIRAWVLIVLEPGMLAQEG